MKITYIGHSGFAAELAHCTLLFDYYEGTLPVFPRKSRCMFFAAMRTGIISTSIFSGCGKRIRM